jgi:ribonuclease J
MQFNNKPKNTNPHQQPKNQPHKGAVLPRFFPGKKQGDRNTLKFIPLGGNGLVTKNFFVYQYGDEILIVDCGMGFPSEEMYGIDIIIPDVTYLKDKLHKIRGIFITHGHEDHIGAIPYLIDTFTSVPIFTAKLTAGLIKQKLMEVDKLRYAKINEVKPGQKLQLGQFQVEPFHVNHSIPDSMGYAITTKLGTTIHTGDYKFDWTPQDGVPADIRILAEYGEKGVLALMSDCLRSEKPGYTHSEMEIQKSFEEVMEQAGGRVLITTFSSNVSRIQQAINASQKFGRKVAVAGRSMENNIMVARDLNYLTLPQDILVKIDQIEKVPPSKLTILVSGAQGQPGSALNRIASAEHRFISIREGDEVVFSADPIPGNQDAVYATIDNLTRLGANVRYSDITNEFHVSGHGAQAELMLMISLTKPKYLVPISGMIRQMQQYANMAEKSGYRKDQIHLIEEGEILEFSPNGVRKNGRIEVDNIMVDGLGVGDVGNVVLRDRQVLAEEGIVVVILTMSHVQNKLVGEPEIVSRGFVYMKEAEKLIDRAKEVVKKSVGNTQSKGQFVREKIVNDLEKFLYEQTQRRPMVIPVIVEV